MRRALPGKLVGSNRFMGGANEEVLMAFRDYDLIAWNAYPMDVYNHGTYTDIQMQRMQLAYDATGLPMIITEFGIQAMDSAVPSPSAKVPSQQRRGEEYAKVVRQVIEGFPFIVGLVPFGWMDSTEGERSNWGMVNPEGQPYGDYLEGMAGTHRDLDQILACLNTEKED